MLSYAFSVLKEQSYRSMATESFENAADLCAAILVHGFKTQVKRSLGREYIEAANSLSTIRGRIDVSGTLTSQAHVRRQTICAYDEFSTDTQVHRVLKATFQLLLHSNISKARKKEIRSLMPHLHEPHFFDPKRVRDGLLLMGWGFFEKLVLADRIALLVTAVYDNPAAHTGVEIVLATVLFAFQIFCDFAGYSDIAIGAARVMGFTLMKNFKHPYSAVTVSDFWRRWHISLTTWFRDYIYIPLGGSRCAKWKHFRNILITFSLSGLWHGAEWSFVVWGALNGLYQVVGSLTAPFRGRLETCLGLDPDGRLRRWWKRLVTFALVDFAWLFFRANSFLTGVGMLRQAAVNPGLSALRDPLAMITVENLGMGRKDFAVLLLALVVLAAVDTLRQRVDLKAVLDRRNIVVRYAVYYVIIFTVLIFGIYGPEFDAASFIYFQF